MNTVSHHFDRHVVNQVNTFYRTFILVLFPFMETGHRVIKMSGMRISRLISRLYILKFCLGMSDSQDAFVPRVIIEDGVCKLADHSALAGSVATMDRLIRTMVQKAEIPLEDAVRMASETPARIMGVLDRKGTLERGKDADIIALDRDLNVRAVWAMGELVEGTNKLF